MWNNCARGIPAIFREAGSGLYVGRNDYNIFGKNFFCGGMRAGSSIQYSSVRFALSTN